MNSLSRAERILFLAMLLAAATLLLVGCAEAGGAAVFAGAVDTLPDGRIVVSNPAMGMWGEGDEWDVTEEVRIGQVDGDGPDVFGSIGLLEVDEEGRYLGRLDLPFKLNSYPRPIFRHGMIYGITLDEFEVPFVVRARVGRQGGKAVRR